MPTGFVVTTASDTPVAGFLTLRQAITAADSATDAATITFNIGNGGAQTISLTAPLPNLTNASGITIDGTTQSGFVPGNPLITLTGNGGTAALTLQGASNNIFDLIFTGFSNDALDVRSSNNTVAGNQIVNNGGIGVNIAPALTPNGFVYFNTIGGASGVTARNIISGNAIGVAIQGDGVNDEAVGFSTVSGNYIGTDVTGTKALNATQKVGVDIFGGTQGNFIGASTAASSNAGTVTFSNLISGNADGIEIANQSTSLNAVEGNLIGTDVTGKERCPIPSTASISSLGPSMTTLVATGATLFRATASTAWPLATFQHLPAPHRL